MSFQESEYVDVEERCRALGIKLPDGIGILPRGFKNSDVDAMRHETSALDVKALLRQQNIPVTICQPDTGTIPYLKENAADWIGPTIFVSVAALSNNPELLSISLGVISNYVTDLFKNAPESPRVSFSVVMEDCEAKTTKAGTKTETRTYREYKFDGTDNVATKFLEFLKEKK